MNNFRLTYVPGMNGICIKNTLKKKKKKSIVINHYIHKTCFVIHCLTTLSHKFSSTENFLKFRTRLRFELGTNDFFFFFLTLVFVFLFFRENSDAVHRYDGGSDNLPRFPFFSYSNIVTTSCLFSSLGIWICQKMKNYEFTPVFAF